ncbi:MAG: hypothetical protein M3P47_02210 [Pseudomonadota bacterium]|nr:hypothetical protein [Pseudomonadota bacterium]
MRVWPCSIWRIPSSATRSACAAVRRSLPASKIQMLASLRILAAPYPRRAPARPRWTKPPTKGDAQHRHQAGLRMHLDQLPITRCPAGGYRLPAGTTK